MVTPGDYPALYGISGGRKAILSKTYNLAITEELLEPAALSGGSTGQEVLDFSMARDDPQASLLAAEMQIVLPSQEKVFRIRVITDDATNRVRTVHCEALWYDLGMLDAIVVTPAQTTATAALDFILAGTGWSRGTVSGTGSGSFSVPTRSTPLACLRALPSIFGGELWFDTLNRKVNIVAVRGDQSGNWLYAHGINLANSQRSIDTTNLYTRVRPIGANSIDISSVNGGVTYLDDSSWFTSQGEAAQIRATVIQNDGISQPTALKAWGLAQLAAISIPKVTYTVDPATLTGGSSSAVPARSTRKALIISRGQSGASTALRDLLVAAGYVVAYNTAASGLADVAGYNLVCADDSVWAVGTGTNANATTLLLAAYNAGYGIVTVGNDTGAGGAVPLISTSIVKTSVSNNPFQIVPTGNHYAAQGWPANLATDTDGGNLPTGYRNTVIPVATMTTSGGVTGYTGLAEYNPAGGTGRWFHSQVFISNTSPASSVGTFAVRGADWACRLTPRDWDPLAGLGDKVRVIDSSIGFNLFARVAQRIVRPLEPGSSAIQINTAAYEISTVLGTPGGSVSSGGGIGTALGPSAPTGLAVTSGQAVDVSGHTYTYAQASWSAVTTNIDGSPINDLQNYEVQYSVDSGAWIPLGRTDQLSIQTPPFRAQAGIAVRVQAWDIGGRNSGWVSSAVTAVKDTVAPPQPSQPTLSTQLPLAIEVFWNGLDLNGLPMPRDFSLVEIHTATVSGFNPTTVNPILTGDQASFEASNGGWGYFPGANGSVTRDTAHVHGGTGSLKVTTAGTPTANDAAFSPVPIHSANPGDKVSLTMWVFATSIINLYVGLECYDSTGSFIGLVSGPNQPTVANAWTQLGSSSIGPLPAGTDRVGAALAWTSAPVSGVSYWVDDVAMALATPTLQDQINNYVGGIGVATQLEPQTTYWVKTRAVDRSGNIGAMTTPISGQVARLIGKHYTELSVVDAHIGSMNVGKLVAGTLAADVTVSSRIKTADSGSRVELNSTGLHAYNAAGTETVHVGSDGSANFIGTVQGSTIVGSVFETAASGARIYISNGGGAFTTTQMLFYSGSSYETNPGEISVDNVAGFNTTALYVGAPDMAANAGLPLTRFEMASPYVAQSTGVHVKGRIWAYADNFYIYGTNEAYISTTSLYIDLVEGTGIAFGGKILSDVGIAKHVSSIVNGTYGWVVNTYGPTMSVIPTVISSLDLGGTTVAQSIAFLSTTSYRQYSSSWTSTFSTVNMHWEALAGQV